MVGAFLSRQLDPRECRAGTLPAPDGVLSSEDFDRRLDLLDLLGILLRPF